MFVIATINDIKLVNGLSLFWLNCHVTPIFYHIFSFNARSLSTYTLSQLQYPDAHLIGTFIFGTPCDLPSAPFPPSWLFLLLVTVTVTVKVWLTVSVCTVSSLLVSVLVSI
mmetsp:Transcript_102635/g.209078  ORF Transcript_102635/g.209078 Transcript_102635/m.209078 type:complete len:111 (+) Transcript_102635:77-409(+)